MKIIYRAQALGDIDEIQRYLVERNPNAAANVVRAIYAGIQLIAERPYANQQSDHPDIRVKVLQRYSDVFVRQMKAQPEAAAHGYDELRKVMAQDGTISTEAQMNELSLRGDMLNMATNQIPPVSAVFDFSWLEKINDELKASGWKPGP